MRTESGEHLEWNYIPTFEHLDLPFEIQPAVVIPPGSYQWTRFRTEVNTATKRPWVVDCALRLPLTSAREWTLSSSARVTTTPVETVYGAENRYFA